MLKIQFYFSLAVSRASVCPATATGSATTTTSPAATASPAPPTTATDAAPAKLTSQKKKFASQFLNFLVFYLVTLIYFLNVTATEKDISSFTF